MPHRTTYFFPRQFPDRSGFDVGSSSSSKLQLLPQPQPLPPPQRDRFTSTTEHEHEHEQHEHEHAASQKSGVLPDLITRCDDDDDGGGDKYARQKKKKKKKKKEQKQQVDWMAVEKRGGKARGGSHVRLERLSLDEDRELLLLREEPEAVVVVDVDWNFDCQVSSGSVHDGSFEIGEETTTTTTTRSARPRRDEEEVSVAERTKQSYCLQLALAKRLSLQYGLAPELVLFRGGLEHDTCDAETVSYRLWVSGCLSYSDKISDGFYNIMGMKPQLWIMCNDDEEGRRMPSLMSLKEIEPSESSMEVVLIDKRCDSRLKDLEDKAQELYFASENMLVLVEKLGRLVAMCLGGIHPMEQGDLHRRWKVVSRRLRDFQKCLVLPIGSLSMGLCRHRAILFKKLADYVGLPCRIAQGCKYCVEDHRSSCLVTIKDDRQLSREYVVDLVGQPGMFMVQIQLSMEDFFH